MRTIVSILSVFLIIIVSSCQSGDKTADSSDKFFRQLKFSETPWDQITGMHEITADEAKSINHYCFSYDDQGRLSSVKYCRDTELLKGSRLGAPMVKISYEENKEIHTYYDLKGEQRERFGFYAAEYKLDDEGTRVGLRFLDQEGNLVENNNGIAWFDWKVLASDQLKENRYNLEGEETVLNEFCPFCELRFTYDRDGFVTRMANYQGDTMYNCTVENCGDIGVSYFTFDYNDAGDLTEFTVNALNGQLSNLYWGWARFENQYDDAGNLTERAMFDQDNEPFGGMNVPVTGMIYDEHGSLVELKFMDIERNLINHPRSGISVSKYGYTENGHPKDTLNYNAEMVQI
jgi:hypothetical protein